MINEAYGAYNNEDLLELSEKARSVTAKTLAGAAEVSESVKNEMKTRIVEYEKTPQYQRFVKFQAFTALAI